MPAPGGGSPPPTYEPSPSMRPAQTQPPGGKSSAPPIIDPGDLGPDSTPAPIKKRPAAATENDGTRFERASPDRFDEANALEPARSPDEGLARRPAGRTVRLTASAAFRTLVVCKGVPPADPDRGADPALPPPIRSVDDNVARTD